jgi:hypothetical protein
MKKIILLLSCFFTLAIIDSASAQGLKAVDDSQNAGKVEWLNRSENVGKIPIGVPITKEFKIRNVSNENLLILAVRTTCHCTTVEWSSEPIKPGETGVVKVTFDAQKEGDFYKIFAVSTNFDPNQTVPLALIGKVEKMQDLSAKQ